MESFPTSCHGDWSVTAIAAFADNYIWALRHHPSATAMVVDPGDATPVIHWLKRHSVRLSAIWVTHHHADHVGGIVPLLAWAAQTTKAETTPVYGPATLTDKGINRPVQDGQTLAFDGGLNVRVWAVPGHTLDHLAYVAEPAHDTPWLFCGDTLFSGGCGRLFEGSPAQMHHSLRRLADLPDHTQVFCTHEYTLSNLKFAQHVFPGDERIEKRLSEVRALRDKGDISLPSSIALEKTINPFLLAKDLEQFTQLRAMKDRF